MKCELCNDTGYYGDNGPGIKGNNEWNHCECRDKKMFPSKMADWGVANLNQGDYILATKYKDGDPCDHFYVGFFNGYSDHEPKRFMVVDNEGNNQRGNGFRRAEKITSEEGRKLIELMPEIGDRSGPSVWWHLKQIRLEQEK